MKLYKLNKRMRSKAFIAMASRTSIRLSYFALFGFIFLNSCKKLVEVESPKTSINAENVYKNANTAASVLTGIYIKISGTYFGQPGSINTLSLYAALSSDELNLGESSSAQKVAYYKNSLSVTSNYGGEFWDNYKHIATCNGAIEGLQDNSDLTPIVKNQLLGEAYFMRAFLYSYQVKIYGDVPLVLTTDYKINATLANSSKQKVYDQIIADLKQAETLLTSGYAKADATFYPPGQEERVRPNKWAAKALLARTYLEMGMNADAEAAATEVINQNSLYQLGTLNGTFLKNSKQAIWQLQPVNLGWNTEDARLFIIPSTGFSGSNPVELSQTLLDSFEPGDLRKSQWVGSINITGDPKTHYYPNKYKSATRNATVTEYEMVLRLGEQYLIRSEARARQGKTVEAAADLNAIRSRAGLAATTATSQPALIDAAIHERQVELFTEWGFRWFDLKRTNTVDAVMAVETPKKGGTWKSFQQLYPIPLNEIQTDPNLVQNPGY